MARSYTLGRRADRQAETRRRIVEAAIELHGELGPARTSLSQVAERAGVQRNTLYAHFPDERSLLMACSGTFGERFPPPDAQAWRAIADRGARLRTGLKAVYGWYEATAHVTARVMRDAEQDPLVGEVAALRFGPAAAGWREVLGEGLASGQKALLHLALGFCSWRALVREAGLAGEAAAEAMARAVETG